MEGGFDMGKDKLVEYTPEDAANYLQCLYDLATTHPDAEVRALAMKKYGEAKGF